MGPITRPDVLPQFEGQPVTLEQLEELVTEGKLPQEQAGALREKHKVLAEALGEVAKQMRSIERKVQDEVEGLNRSMVQDAIHDVLREIRDRFPQPAVSVYLGEVEEHIVEHFGRSAEEEKSEEGEEATDPYHVYGVNLVVDNQSSRTVPIVTETHPSYAGLFGTVEISGERELGRADFSHLRAGSLVRADGGFLILNAVDVLSEPGVWPALKRTLRTGRVEIRSVEHSPYPWGTAIKAEPIEIRTKVVMIGDGRLYSLLYELDEDFRKIFKVKAEFDADMARTPPAVDQYARFVAKICVSEKLPPFDRGAVAHVVEYGVRRAGHQERLSTHFTFVKDVIVEAAYWARQENASLVREAHVERALGEQLTRVNLAERKVKEAIRRGEIIITTEGAAVGQVNGLAIYSLGDYAFGVPARITASVGVGRAGIINIEREAALSGSTHDKGVLILSGFLRSRFAHEMPLALSASVCFEQSYGGVDGDSASSTEIYALLSSLANLPIRQDIAVTGSVNQHGEVQPIGGVNEKVEGFYDICALRGFGGTEGVLVPRRNLGHFMLREDIVQAVKEGRFHVYAVDTVDEGIEVLTGVEAGKRPEGGGPFPPASVNGRVEARLRELADLVRPYGLGETL
jgi:ATP-dependent Lon protease